jgi:large-conductance mechanosensitive channel
MKFFVINSFRTMVYVAYIAIIVAGIGLGIYNAGEWSGQILSLGGALAQIVDFLVFSFAGWVLASLICGLIVTLLDIRDDINDRLPDARLDD